MSPARLALLTIDVPWCRPTIKPEIELSAFVGSNTAQKIKLPAGTEEPRLAAIVNALESDFNQSSTPADEFHFAVFWLTIPSNLRTNGLLN
jgi:hypothetical protein